MLFPRTVLLLTAAAVAVLLCGGVRAQSVTQAGPSIGGHSPMYVIGPGQGFASVMDSGFASGLSAAGTTTGAGLSELLQVNHSLGSGPLGTHVSLLDAPVNHVGGYHYLSLDANPNGSGGLLTYGAAGGAPQLPFTCIINGVTTLNCLSAPSVPGVGAYVNVVSNFGAHPDGITDNAAILATIFATTNGDTFYFPPGTYRVSCGHVFNAASPLSLIGASRMSSIIRFDAGCTFPNEMNAAATGGVFLWNNMSAVRLSDLTIDLNFPTASSHLSVPVQIAATVGTITGPYINNFSVINGRSPTNLLSVLAGNGSLVGPVITNGFFALAAPATTQNQCIAVASYQNLGGSGIISNAVVSNNTCVNTAIEVDGDSPVISGNNVSGFQFGTGIFTLFTLPSASAPLSCRNATISGNIIHDTPGTFDVNGTAPGGVESDCPGSVGTGNVAYNLGGEGFRIIGDNQIWSGNIAYNNGKSGVSCPSGYCQGGQAGFFVYSSAGNARQAAGKNESLVGNTAFDNGSGTQKYGFVVYNNAAPGDVTGQPIFLRSNNFTGATQGELWGLTSPESPPNQPPEYFNTQYTGIIPQPSFSWTNLDTATFRSWTLQCDNILPDLVSDIFYLQVGEGSGPTWKTASLYSGFLTVIHSGGGTLTPYGPINIDGIPLTGPDNMLAEEASGYPGTFTVHIGNLAWPSPNEAFKMMRYSGSFFTDASAFSKVEGFWGWQGDQNPITAIRIFPKLGGNMLGQCTLTGRH